MTVRNPYVTQDRSMLGAKGEEFRCEKLDADASCPGELLSDLCLRACN